MGKACGGSGLVIVCRRNLTTAFSDARLGWSDNVVHPSRVEHMADSFSTDLFPLADRLDAWLYKASQICGDCRFQVPRVQAFQGCIDKRTVAGLELTRFSSTPVSFRKFPVVSAKSSERSCIIITQLEGAQSYHQGGSAIILKPGDSTLLDAGMPWSSDCAGRCSRLYLRLPLGEMQEHVQLCQIPLLPHISGQGELGATLFELLTSLFSRAEILDDKAGLCAINAYLQTWSACLHRAYQPPIAAPRRRQIESRIERFIEDHLGDAALTPSAIAGAMGISVRHLHRVFAVRGRTLGTWVRERRLERCWSDISDQRSSASITEVAFSWGFSDSAHFSRCFRRRFGMSPREFRARSRRNAGEPRPSDFFHDGSGTRLLN